MINALLSRPRRLIATLALLLAATGVAIGSGASFTSSTATAANTFSSGTLTQSNTKSGVAVLTAANMKPGDTTTGTVTIKNTGSLSGKFVASESGYTSTFDKTTLDLKIADGSTVLYTGKLNAFAPKDLGTWAAGEAHTYTFTVTFPTTTDAGGQDQNTDQGRSASVSFGWAATQAAGKDLTADPAGTSNGTLTVPAS